MIAFEKSVGAVVFRRENDQIKYLIVQYRNKHWEFPRGHQENGETDKQTARREIMEETGIGELQILPEFFQNTYFWYIAKDNERQERKKARRGIFIIKKAKFFLAETKIAEIKLSQEQLEFVWLPYEEALEKITYRNAKNVLRKANNYLAILSA